MPKLYTITLDEKDYETLMSELYSLQGYHWNDDRIHANDCGSKVIDKIQCAVQVTEVAADPVS